MLYHHQLNILTSVTGSENLFQEHDRIFFKKFKLAETNIPVQSHYTTTATLSIGCFLTTNFIFTY